MEVGKKRDVVLRLALAAGGVALTLVFAAATIGCWFSAHSKIYREVSSGRESLECQAVLGRAVKQSEASRTTAPFVDFRTPETLAVKNVASRVATKREEITPAHYYIPAEEVLAGPSLSAPSSVAPQTAVAPQAEWQAVPLLISAPTERAPKEEMLEKERVVVAPEVFLPKTPPFKKPSLKTTLPTRLSFNSSAFNSSGSVQRPGEIEVPEGLETCSKSLSPNLSDDDLRGYTASLNAINRRLQPEVQKGFALGKSGAIYAARAQFVRVLRKIALAKDAESGTRRCTTALADGLRALDEADDFVPRGDALEAELDTLEIAASHGTPIVREAGYEEATPHEAIALYSRYAAEKIGEAVAGEQAGSMACYGLGKAYARLEVQGEDPTAGRKSAVLHRAAIEAHEGNYMAANELGVWLARIGRYDQASRVLRQATAHGAPISTVYENLAKVEEKRGKQKMALAARQQSQQIARAEIAQGALSQRRGIEWVDAGAFRQPGVPAPSMPTAPMPAAPIATTAMPAAAPQRVASRPYPQQRAPQPPQRVEPPRVKPSGWQKLKQAAGWSVPQPSQASTSVDAWRPHPNAPRQIARQPAVVR